MRMAKPKVRRSSKRTLLVAFLLVAFSGPAMASDWWADAFITVITGDNLPTYVTFQIDRTPAGSTCPAGTFLNYQPANPDNMRGVFGILLSAKLSGKSVRVYGNNAGCAVTGLHFNG